MGSRSKAGFDKNPQNINRKGRPKKEHSMTHILATVMKEEQVKYNGQYISGKEAVSRKALELAMKGDMTAIKYIFDRIDGTPVQQVVQSNEMDDMKTMTPKERGARMKELMAALNGTGEEDGPKND